MIKIKRLQGQDKFIPDMIQEIIKIQNLDKISIKFGFKPIRRIIAIQTLNINFCSSSISSLSKLFMFLSEKMNLINFKQQKKPMAAPANIIEG